MLFDLPKEPLAIALRDHKGITGMWRNGIGKVALYADDLLLFLSNPEVSLHYVPPLSDLISS